MDCAQHVLSLLCIFQSDRRDHKTVACAVHYHVVKIHTTNSMVQAWMHLHEAGCICSSCTALQQECWRVVLAPAEMDNTLLQHAGTSSVANKLQLSSHAQHSVQHCKVSSTTQLLGYACSHITIGFCDT